MPRLCLLALLLVLSGTAFAQSFEALGGRNGTTYWGFSSIQDLSYDGETLLGRTFLPDGNGSSDPIPAILDGGTVERLNVLDGRLPFVLSGDGEVVGGRYATTGCTDPNDPLRNCAAPFVYDRDTGGLTELSLPVFGPRQRQNVFDVLLSEDGSIVVATVQLSKTGQTDFWTFRWTNGNREEISHIVLINGSPAPSGLYVARGLSADGRVIVGYGTNGPRSNIVRYANGMLTYSGVLPPYDDTTFITDDVLSADGAYSFGLALDGPAGDPSWEAVRWDGASLAPLGFAEIVGSRYRTEARGTSRDGSVALLCETDRVPGGFADYDVIWTARDGVRGMLDLFTTDYGFDLSAFEFELGSCLARKMRGDRVLVGGAFINDGGSPRRAAAWRARLAPPQTEITVNVTGDASDLDVMDGICDSDASMAGDQCTLRAAIEMANAQAGRDSVVFAIPGTAPHTIAVPRSLPTLAQPIAIDAMTQPGYTGVPLVRLQGAGMARGLVFTGGNSAVRGLSIGGFSGAGVTLQGDGGSTVEACWVGIAPDGTTAIANGTGILVDGAPDNVIGSPEAARFNLIGNNTGVGIEVKGTGATGNRLIRNVLGISLSGTTLAANGSAAIRVSGGALNTVIGTAVEGNRIAGTSGIEIEDLGATGGAPDGTVVQGNRLGLTLNGSAVLGEMANGIIASGPTATRGVTGLTIGGAEAGEGNVVVATFGVAISGARSSGAVIRGNTLGLKADGALARTEAVGLGIFAARADQTQIVGNVVGGYGFGVVLASNENVVVGNLIGLDPTGEEARPNTIGLLIPGSYISSQGTTDVGDRNVVGTQEAPNVISGSVSSGMLLGFVLDLSNSGATLPAVSDVARAVARLASRSHASGAAASRHSDDQVAPADGNVIAFNRIGTNKAGTQQVGNGRVEEGEPLGPAGINIIAGTGNRVLGNLISGNGGGMGIGGSEDVAVFGTIVAGNVIGGSMTSGETIPNQLGGIDIQGAQGTRVIAAPLAEGGPDVGNTIVGNEGPGVVVVGGSDTRIRGSSFEGNDGPSIATSFGIATAEPVEVSATATPGTASFRMRPIRAGEIDVFVSPDCTDGNADGTYLLTVTATEDQFQTISVPYPSLGGSPNASIGLYLAMTQTETADTRTTSRFTDCVRITRPEDVAEAEVADGQTGVVVDGVGIEVDLTENGAPRVPATDQAANASTLAGGTLYVSRYGEQILPEPGPFEGTASAPSGVTVTPNAVSTNRHWTLRTDGLENVTYDVCLDVDGIRGVLDPQQLLVLYRPTARAPWTPFDTVLDGTRLCASGFTAWGDLGIGADSLVNPVPNEPGPGEAPEALPTAFGVQVWPNPTVSTATIEVALPEATDVRAKVYDLLGRRVALLHDGLLAAGTHPLAFDAARLPAGVYVVRAVTPEATLTRRLTVVR